MNRETRWGSPQRVADGDEKKILMEKLMITETWAGPQDSNSLLIPTDTVLTTETRISVHCNQEH